MISVSIIGTSALLASPSFLALSLTDAQAQEAAQAQGGKNRGHASPEHSAKPSSTTPSPQTAPAPTGDPTLQSLAEGILLAYSKGAHETFFSFYNDGSSQLATKELFITLIEEKFLKTFGVCSSPVLLSPLDAPSAGYFTAEFAIRCEKGKTPLLKLVLDNARRKIYVMKFEILEKP